MMFINKSFEMRVLEFDPLRFSLWWKKGKMELLHAVVWESRKAPIWHRWLAGVVLEFS
jgi:hypothetical protein